MYNREDGRFFDFALNDGATHLLADQIPSRIPARNSSFNLNAMPAFTVKFAEMRRHARGRFTVRTQSWA